jgi:benzodiazapine receptor
MKTLLVFLPAVALAAFVGTRFPPGAWHQGLVKPSWNPPNWIFAPVWSVLYLAIALAGWLYSRSVSGPLRLDLVLALWAVQLVLNAAWSWLFFGLHSPGAAFVDILLLLVAIVWFAFAAHRASAAAAWLFVPYALWVSFATALNAAIWYLNRSPAA